MTLKIDDTLEASKEILAKHGIRRTSMSDIAEVAGVSRQTLYSRFGNKEGIVQAVILYTTDQSIATIGDQWQTCTSLAAKLDIYGQHAVVEAYLILQAMPDAADLHSPEHPMVVDAFREAESKYTSLLRSMLKPYSAQLKQHRESTSSVAEFIVTTGYAMKNSAKSEADLKKKLATLRRMVSVLVGTDDR